MATTRKAEPTHKVDIGWDFNGPKGILHADGDEFSLRTITLDVRGKNPKDAIVGRIEFKGDMSRNLMDFADKAVDFFSPMLYKALTSLQAKIAPEAEREDGAEETQEEATEE